VINYNNALFALGSQILQNDYNASIPPEISDGLIEEQEKIIGAYLFVRLDEEIGKYSSWADLKNLNLSYSIESRLIESSSRLPAWYVYVEK
jgi:hypothetical protein